MKLKLIDATHTVGNFRPCDLGLNLLADKAGNKGARGLQTLSLITHPTDLAMQALLFTVLCPTNPFITVGINLLNKNWGRAAISLPTAPFKVVISSARIPFYVAFKAVQMVWAVTVNPYVNVIRGSKQTETFFTKYNHRNSLAQSDYREQFRWTKKKTLSIPIPVDLRVVDKSTLEAELDKSAPFYTIALSVNRGFNMVFTTLTPDGFAFPYPAVPAANLPAAAAHSDSDDENSYDTTPYNLPIVFATNPYEEIDSADEAFDFDEDEAVMDQLIRNNIDQFFTANPLNA